MLRLNWKGGRRTFIEQFINIPFFLFLPSSMVKLSINQQFFMIIRRFLGFVLKGFTRKNFLLSNVDGWTDPAWARRVSSSQAWGRALDGATIELNPGWKKLLRNGKKNIISCFFRLLWIFILGSIFFIFFPCDGGKAKKDYFHSVLRDNAAEAEDGKTEKQSQSCEQSFQLSFSSRDVVETFGIKLVFSLI